MIVRTAVFLVASFMLLTTAARALGHFDLPDPGLEGFTNGCVGQPQPCWYGIIPGETTVGAARTILEQLGYAQTQGEVELQDFLFVYADSDQTPGCIDVFYGRELGYVGALMLRCMELQAGDVAALLGSPVHWRQPQAGIMEWHYDRFIIQLAYGWRPSLYAPVQHIRLTNEIVPTQVRLQWRGFLLHWKYCQHEPTLTGCGT